VRRGRDKPVLCGCEAIGEVDSAMPGWIRAERPLEENKVYDSLSLLNLSEI
jgi:hypothetical protein